MPPLPSTAVLEGAAPPGLSLGQLPCPPISLKRSWPLEPPPFGGSGLGSTCWVQQGHPFWSPTHRSVRPGPRCAPRSGDSGRTVLATPNSLSSSEFSQAPWALSLHLLSVTSSGQQNMHRSLGRGQAPSPRFERQPGGAQRDDETCHRSLQVAKAKARCGFMCFLQTSVLLHTCMG